MYYSLAGQKAKMGLTWLKLGVTGLYSFLEALVGNVVPLSVKPTFSLLKSTLLSQRVLININSKNLECYLKDFIFF